MANVKFNVTRKAALENVLRAIADNGITFDDDTIAVVENMSARLVAAPRAKGESVAHKQNAAILSANMDLIASAGDEGITCREFVACAADGFPVNTEGKRSINKGTAVLRQGVNNGILRAVMGTKKSDPIRYKLA